MAYKFTRLANDYIDLKNDLTDKEIDEIVSIGAMDRIQANAVPSKDDLIALNKRYFSKYPKTGFRLYSLPSERQDMTNLQYLTNAEKISVDFVSDADNLEVLSLLPNLKKLWLHIYLLRDFGFLNGVTSSLSQLSLETKSTALDLSALLRFSQLKVLRLVRYKKNIDSLAGLSLLEGLTLRGITPESLDFVNELKNLRRLKIELGAKADLSDLYGNTSITALRLFRISNLGNADLIARLPNLEAVELSWLPHIGCFPDLSEHKKLRHIALDDMKTLTDLSALEHASSLESFSFSVCPRVFEPGSLLPVLRNPSVKQCSAYTSSAKRNKEMGDLIVRNGKRNENNSMIVRRLLSNNLTEF